MAVSLHPFYEEHRAALEDVMRQRLDLAEPMLRERTHLTDIDSVKKEAMREFEIVLAQTPFVGGSSNRMSDFFMRLIGFIAISRVLLRCGVAPRIIGEIERDAFRAQLLMIPETDRVAAGLQFMSRENQLFIEKQAAASATAKHQQDFPDDFVYDFVEPGPNDAFEFGINYKACGFCKFASRHGDQEILPNICGLDFVAYAAQGIHLERTQTLAGGASHCNFRFSRMKAD
ncbi:MAG: L-2-amino-thiazoline-4-carboxylic acid hydrolase [Hyphomicrobiales bacterium]|nr:L-2-amino-thiazoline-4-carboxylic acid hydrolase [Hyphomicrobiales bacterium]